jgi:flagellar hook assembly protein FlgD
MRNYPNPFNSITNISYHIPGANMVILRVYDIFGREVITLVNEEQTTGYYSVPWDSKDYLGRNVASGMYFYQLRFEDQMVTNKMILMR